METARRNDGSSQVQQRKRWKDYMNPEFLKALPGTSEKDYVTEENLLKIISHYYAKCRDLLDKEFECSEELKNIKDFFKMGKEISGTSSLREVVCASEIILTEYEIHVGDLVRQQDSTMTENERKDSNQSIEPEGFKILLDRTAEENCLELLVRIYFKVGLKLNAVKEMPKVSRGKTGRMRKASKKSSAEESPAKGSPSHRMEFLKDLMTIISAALILFDRFKSTP